MGIKLEAAQRCVTRDKACVLQCTKGRHTHIVSQMHIN